ncbi:GerMN domain-containing protein [uncultured Fusobacterium sp.]|uniref:GerMN domain-containing protein n=1 Tax=uncultured Fusobacterium sp. TaxID=159267 RepID=UPI0015A50E98|nr:GerMN domain-containing protein [uncultured Fusobacterium sp.]
MINFRNNNEENNEKKKNLKYEPESLHLNVFIEKDDLDEEKSEKKEDIKKSKFNFEKKEKKSNSPSAIKKILSLIKENLSKIKKSFAEGENLSIKIMVGLWCITIISGILYFNSSSNDAPKVVFERKSTIKESEKEKIYIFFPDGEKLVSSELEVNKIESKNMLMRRTLDETIRRLKELDKIPNINEKVEVFCYLIDNVVYLDLPEKLFDKVKSPKDELLLIYSFVNTMTNVDTNIKTVKILINGMDTDKVKYANLKRDFKFRKDI